MQMEASMKAIGLTVDRAAMGSFPALREPSTMETGATICSMARVKSAGPMELNMWANSDVDRRLVKECSAGQMGQLIKEPCSTVGSMGMGFTHGLRRAEFTQEIGPKTPCMAKVALNTQMEEFSMALL
jgi:hypothetical protein